MPHKSNAFYNKNILNITLFVFYNNFKTLVTNILITDFITGNNDSTSLDTYSMFEFCISIEYSNNNIMFQENSHL